MRVTYSRSTLGQTVRRGYPRASRIHFEDLPADREPAGVANKENKPPVPADRTVGGGAPCAIQNDMEWAMAKQELRRSACPELRAWLAAEIKKYEERMICKAG